MKKKPKDLAAIRIDWLIRKHQQAVDDYNFANGYRAGLECALTAIQRGEDLIGYSIDDGKADIMP